MYQVKYLTDLIPEDTKKIIDKYWFFKDGKFTFTVKQLEKLSLNLKEA